MYRFELQESGEYKPLNIYLMKPDETILCGLNQFIDEESASLKVKLNGQSSISFEIKHEDEFLYFDHLQEGMYLFVDQVGKFKIDSPTITNDGVIEIADVTAYSIESELEDKICQFMVNTGTESSQEYLVTYDDEETELLINPLDESPYDWILLYNTIPEQLTLFKNKLNNGHYGSFNSGSLTITDTSLISEIETFCGVCPRIIRKMTKTGDGTGYNTETYIETNRQESTAVIQSIVIYNTIFQRIADLIVFYNKYRSQLSLLDIALSETCGVWSVDHVYGTDLNDYSLANMKLQVDIDESIYSFITNTLSGLAEALPIFDTVSRTVSMIPFDDIGSNTGITVSYDKLLNQLKISNPNDRFSTRFFVTGGDDLDIRQVNLGKAWVCDLNYKMNAVDSNGKRIYVTDSLANRYATYEADFEAGRKQSIEYVKMIDSYTDKIYDLKYRVPNDAVSTDWGTFSMEDLNKTLVSYQNMLAVIIVAYESDYPNNCHKSDGSLNETHLRTTIYWHDYYCYKQIIEEIHCAIDNFPYYADQTKWSTANIEKYKEAIKSWETEWSLYGSIELNNICEKYTSQMSIMSSQGLVICYSGSGEDTEKPIPWSELTEVQKAKYGNIESQYQYGTYNNYYLNKKNAAGAATARENEISKYDAEISAYTKLIDNLKTKFDIDNYTFQDNTKFSNTEKSVINRMYKDYEYSNTNIIVTDLMTASQRIDTMDELLQDGKKNAYILSRPQLQFDITMENLYALPDYYKIASNFNVGNYLLVQYRDNTYIKLRIVEYTINPCLPSKETLDVKFSNFIRSIDGISDLESVLQSSSLSSNGGSGGSSSNSGSGTSGFDSGVVASSTVINRLLDTALYSKSSISSYIAQIMENKKDIKEHIHDNASYEESGFMSKDDKKKVDSLNLDMLITDAERLKLAGIANGATRTIVYVQQNQPPFVAGAIWIRPNGNPVE